MEDVSDPFRALCKENGRCWYTEFISSEGLQEMLISTMKLDIYTERPIGIQIFGHDINSMRLATEILKRKPGIY